MLLGLSPQTYPFSAIDPDAAALPADHWRPVVQQGNADFGLGWASINPEPGVWNWDTLDTYASKAPAAKGGSRGIIFPLFYAAPWHVGPRDPVDDEANFGLRYKMGPARLDRGSWVSDPAQWPAFLDAWSEFCDRIAERYAGLMHFELGNEPRLDPVFGPMARLARAAVKLRDPEALILSPAISNIRGRGVPKYDVLPGWLSSPDGAGGRLIDHCDVLSVHTYPGYPIETPVEPTHAGPQHVSAWTPVLRAMLATLDRADMPLWATESGYVQFPEYRNPATPDVEAKRARFVRDCIHEHRRNGYMGLTYFLLDGGNGLDQSPAGRQAYRQEYSKRRLT